MKMKHGARSDANASLKFGGGGESHVSIPGGCSPAASTDFR